MSYSPSDEEDPPSFFVRALYTYTATDKSSLSFERGDIIEVLTQLPTGWWDGILCDQRGWFPSNYVETIDEETAQRELDEREMALGLKPTLDFDVADDEEADIRAVDALAAAGGHTQATTGLESALSLSTATYPNDGDFSAALGLGQDFAALRELMGTGEGGAGLPGVDGNATDAFEQLAEAAMLDAGRDPWLAAEDGEAPPAMTASGRNPDIDLTGAPSRSMAQTDSFGRPRASTALEPQRSANGSNDWQSRGRAASAAGPQSRQQQQQQPTQQSAKPAIQKKAAAAKESDYWVPKFTDGGDVSLNRNKGFCWMRILTSDRVSLLRSSITTREPAQSLLIYQTAPMTLARRNSTKQAAAGVPLYQKIPQEGVRPIRGATARPPSLQRVGNAAQPSCDRRGCCVTRRRQRNCRSSFSQAEPSRCRS